MRMRTTTWLSNMAESIQHPHRPGPLKQQNKAHKHGKHKSKGTIASMNKGRIDLKVLSGKRSKDFRRKDRRNQIRQIRSNKRNEMLNQKRSVGVDGSPPYLVVIIPLSGSVNGQEVFSSLSVACESSDESSSYYSSTKTLIFPVTRQRFSFLFPLPNDLYGILDAAKVADTLLFVYKGGEALSSFAELVLDTCSAQGIPSTFHVVTFKGLSEISKKNGSAFKKSIQNQIERRFPKDKLRSFDTKQDVCNALRFIGEQRRQSVHFRDTHPHLVAESVRFVEEAEELKCGLLKISGYVRGRSLSVNGLVHIPDLGDFQMSQIDSLRDPCPIKGHVKTTPTNEMPVDSSVELMDEEVKVLEVADPSKQESLVSEVVPDPMEGEQTWPTQEELEEAERRATKSRVLKNVPKGTSDYQAAWIIDSGGEEYEEEIGVDEEEEGQWEGLENDSSSDTEAGSRAASTMDTDSVTGPNADQYDAMMDFDEEKRQVALLQAEKDYQMFPDEVDTPTDVPARVRFGKYRGLRSFKNSPWDSKENLPLDYARIFQFQNFKRTKKRVFSSMDEEGAMTGWYVTVHISGVPKTFATALDLTHKPLIIYGLLPYENKMSVLNFLLKRTPHYPLTIKSKEELVFQCGSRRFLACPLFSQHTQGDKHKFERFLPQDAVGTVATVYSPITYPPSTVLVFKQFQGSHVLVATGVLLSVDPSRIVCKRILLSGHPFKIHKRSAVIRYMFFKREDVQWFQPVELRTKHGLKGNIKEPLGTHGHMKCIFDKQLKAHDTVLMPLYKRVFPKWTYDDFVPRPLSWTTVELSNEEEDKMHL